MKRYISRKVSPKITPIYFYAAMSLQSIIMIVKAMDSKSFLLKVIIPTVVSTNHFSDKFSAVS